MKCREQSSNEWSCLETGYRAACGRAALVFLCFIALGSRALAETLSLLPSKDNTLYEDAGGQISNGQGIFLFAGKTGVRRRV